jgi:MurNAc alpha-1-phosphate uridylyltransferase
VKAMILAAGRGRRMRPETDHTPKPLLRVAGRALIEHQIERLRDAGVRELVINTAWLGGQIEQALGDGAAWGVRIQYSREALPLETAGGIVQALPLLGDEPFVVVNGDIFSDYDPARLPPGPDGLAHLVLVDNPEHNARGDFGLDARGRIDENAATRLTFAGMGVYRPELFTGLEAGERKLAPLLHAAARRGQVTGERHEGTWLDVGTPERLEQLDRQLRGLS